MLKGDFEYIQELVEKHSGIVLTFDKTYLIETRLAPLLRREKLDAVADLVSILRNKPFGALHDWVIDKMTTNETSFFRDQIPFEAMKNSLIPELVEARKEARTLSIWSAACSSGQEPYCISMLIRENFPDLQDWNIKIIATDISNSILDKARSGCYNQFEIQRGLPENYLKYFVKQDNLWKIKREIQDDVVFQQLNLLDIWHAIPKMDIILMRNVLTYFDQDVKENILSKINQVLRPDGYLFLGQSETVPSTGMPFELHRIDASACYRIKSFVDEDRVLSG